MAAPNGVELTGDQAGGSFSADGLRLNQRMDDSRLNILWSFVRGDMAVTDFEAWLYAETDLEPLLGESLHFELISADFKDRNAVFLLQRKVESLLRPLLKCECITLKDADMVPMGGDGDDERFFATVETVRQHGGGQWWLHLDRCRACGQHWMIASEERIYDDYYLKRLDAGKAGQINEDGLWPDDFMTYEKVLEQGLELGKACRFLDPMAKSLVWTAQELKAARPNITPAEIADLLGIDVDHVGRLLVAPR